MKVDVHAYYEWAAFLLLLPSSLFSSFSFQLSFQRSLYLSHFFLIACTRMLASPFQLSLSPSPSLTPSAPSCLPPSILSPMLVSYILFFAFCCHTPTQHQISYRFHKLTSWDKYASVLVCCNMPWHKVNILWTPHTGIQKI